MGDVIHMGHEEGLLRSTCWQMDHPGLYFYFALRCMTASFKDSLTCMCS